MPAELIRNEDMADYHGNALCSSSKLRSLNQRGPFFYRGRYIDRTIPADEPTPALILGCACDTLITEGVDAFNAKYIVRPEGMNFTTKEGKLWKEMHSEPGKETLKYDEWVMLDRMRAALFAHPLYAMLTANVIAQATVRVPETQYGFGIQCRPDWLSLVPCAISGGLPYSVNLKTTLDWHLWFDESDPDGDRQGKPIYDHGYHRQAALDQWCLAQHEQIGETAHFLMVVEKEESYRVGVVQMTEEYLEAGWYETEADLLRLAECYRTGKWPNGRTDVLRIGPPRWLLKRAERKGMAV